MSRRFQKKKAKNAKKLSKIAFILPLLLIISLIANSIASFVEAKKLIQLRKQFPFWFAGKRFEEFKPFLKNQNFVGYFTDKDMSLKSPQNIANFQQAQFSLAPSVLELHATDHNFVLFDCSSPDVAIQKIQDMKAQPIKANNYGIVLVRTTSK